MLKSKPVIEALNGYTVVRQLEDSCENKTRSGIVIQGVNVHKETLQFAKVLVKNDDFNVGEVLILNNHSIRKFTFEGFGYEIVHNRDILGKLTITE